MSRFRTIQLTSVEDLRAASAAWDDLWWRSDVALPLVRAELLAQWVEHFEPNAAFRAIVVAEGDRWIAALPLVSGRVGWLIPAGKLPCNPWVPCAELLCDAAADNDATMDLLLAAAAKLPWCLLWLNETMPETPRWQAFLRACDRAGNCAHYHERFRSGRVEINQSWELYRKRLAKSHRQGITRSARRLACEGKVQFEMHHQLDPQRVEPWLSEAFKVEQLGWKGEAGTSVLDTPGMFDFFVRQAEQLAHWGQLETAALRLDGRLLAFVHGFRAKGVYFAHKISYDPCFAAFSPGQLLFHHILEQLHNDGEAQALDFMGPVKSLSRWRPTTYGVGRVVLAPRRLLGRMALCAYQNIWRRLRRQPAAVGARVGVRAPSPDDSPVPEPAGASG